jgi:hypothetical protein
VSSSRSRRSHLNTSAFALRRGCRRSQEVVLTHGGCRKNQCSVQAQRSRRVGPPR